MLVKRYPLFAGLILCCALSVGGCTAQRTLERERFFWPPLPQEPKIEFIRAIAADYDVTIGGESRLKETVLGREHPRPFMKRPLSVAAAHDKVYVGDSGLRKVFVLDLAGKAIRTLQDEAGQEYHPTTPNKIVVDRQNHVWVMDTKNRLLSRFSPNERRIETLGMERVQRPLGFALDEEKGRIYVADGQAHKIVVLDRSGAFLFEFGGFGKGAGQFNIPSDIVRDAAGHVVVLDSMNCRIQIFDGDGTFVRAFGERGTMAGSFAVPKYLALSPAGHLYVTDSAHHKIVVYSLAGEFLLSLGGKYFSVGGEIAPGGMALPAGISVDEKNRIWVVDGLNAMIHNFQYLDAAYLKKHPLEQGTLSIPVPQ